MNQLCSLCPRNCRIDRTKQQGFCGAPFHATVAKAMLHQWEEPAICYGDGSGAVFFSCCQLRCVFCQNYSISQAPRGRAMKNEELTELFLKLEEKGACNINLVSPTPYLESVIPALEHAKTKGLSIPIVYNTGGYESILTLKRLDGLIDIYLPDFKFASSQLSERYTNAADYPEKCVEALHEMYRQTGPLQWEGDHLKRGLIVRHLVLPGASSDSYQVLAGLADLFPADGFILSLLRQYTPMHRASQYPELSRKLTSLEYKRVCERAEAYGFQHVYTQSKESAKEEFVPDFSVFFEENN